MPRYAAVEFLGLWYVHDTQTGKFIPCEDEYTAKTHAAALNLIARVA